MNNQDLIHSYQKKKFQYIYKIKNVNHIMKRIRFTHPIPKKKKNDLLTFCLSKNLRRGMNGGKIIPLNLQTLITVVLKLKLHDHRSSFITPKKLRWSFCFHIQVIFFYFADFLFSIFLMSFFCIGLSLCLAAEKLQESKRKLVRKV